MKLTLRFVAVLLLAAFMASCSSSNQVAHNGIVQKRKYRKGYHLDLGKNKQRHEIAQAHEQVASPQVLEMETVAEEAPSNPSVKQPGHDVSEPKLDGGDNQDRRAWRWRSSAEQNTRKVVQKVTDLVPARSKPDEQSIPRQEPLDETDSSEPDPKEVIALIAGILTWVFVLVGGVAALLGIPFIGLLALPCAIIAVIVGSSLRKESSLAMIGYILGLVYLIIVAVMLALTIIILLVFLIFLLALL